MPSCPQFNQGGQLRTSSFTQVTVWVVTRRPRREGAHRGVRIPGVGTQLQHPWVLLPREGTAWSELLCRCVGIAAAVALLQLFLHVASELAVAVVCRSVPRYRCAVLSIACPTHAAYEGCGEIL